MLAKLRSYARNLRRRDTFEDVMDDEMRFHIDARTEDLVQRGVPPIEAARRARLEFGSIEKQKDLARASIGVRTIDELRADVRFAVRAMGKDLQLTLTIVGTLALGIGATAAMFSAVNAALLRPLPFPNPSQLVMVSGGDNNMPAVP